MKKVQVNTPLILEQNGEMVRIETGQIIDLTDEVYSEVSAHTTLLDDVSDKPVFEPQPMPEIQGEPTPDEVATEVDETTEPKKSTRKKA